MKQEKFMGDCYITPPSVTRSGGAICCLVAVCHGGVACRAEVACRGDVVACCAEDCLPRKSGAACLRGLPAKENCSQDTGKAVVQLRRGCARRLQSALSALKLRVACRGGEQRGVVCRAELLVRRAGRTTWLAMR